MSEAHFEMFEGDAVGHSELKHFYKKMNEESIRPKIFWNNTMNTQEVFTEYVLNNTWFFFGYQENSLVGAVWFTDFLEKSCKIHICSFRGYEAVNFIEPINGLLKYILDNDSFPCYRIKATTRSKGIVRLHKRFGFTEVSYEKIKSDVTEYHLVRKK